MRILDLYIGKIILTQTLLAMGVLLGLFTFVNFIDQLADLGEAGYTLWDAVRYVLLITPRTIYELFPMAALLGTILGLSMMAADSELVVLRASGISLFQIVWSVLKVGALFVVSAILIGELVTPTTETMAQRGRAEALQRNIKQQTNFGLWMRDTRTYVNVGEVLPDLTLLRVRVFEFDQDNRLRSLVYANEGRYGDNTWELVDVKQTLIADGGNSNAQTLPRAAWTTAVTPQILSVFLIKPDQLSLWQLSRYITHLRDNNQETATYELAYWGKLMLPISTAVMVILAIPFVFRNIRIGGLGRSLFIGIMIGIGFYVLNRGFGYGVLVYGVSPFLGAAIPVTAFLLIAILMLRQTR